MKKNEGYFHMFGKTNVLNMKTSIYKNSKQYQNARQMKDTVVCRRGKYSIRVQFWKASPLDFENIYLVLWNQAIK